MQRAHEALTCMVMIGLGCGARTGLDEGDASPPGVDAGQCGSAVVAPGAVIWQLDLPTDMAWSGPRAADADGVTYFLGTPAGPTPRTYSLLAVDPCGAVLWRSDGATDLPQGPRSTVLVSRDQVVVQWGAVDSFDRRTGARRWNASIIQYSIRSGFGNPANASFSAVGPSAAARDGTVFLPYQSSQGGNQILAVSPTGGISSIASLPRQNDGTPLSLIVDRAGQLDVLLNSTLAGALVRSYSPRGTPIFSSSFPCVRGFLGGLASGTDFILMQTAPCTLTLRGGVGVVFSSAIQSFDLGVIDAQNNLYLGGTSRGLQSVDARGRVRWSSTSSYVVGGPLLGTGRRVFVAERASNTAPITLAALDSDTGVVVWERDFAVGTSALSGLPVLLTPPGQLVFGSQNHVVSIASGSLPSSDAPWPTPNGGFDQRHAAIGQ